MDVVWTKKKIAAKESLDYILPYSVGTVVEYHYVTCKVDFFKVRVDSFVVLAITFISVRTP